MLMHAQQIISTFLMATGGVPDGKTTQSLGNIISTQGEEKFNAAVDNYMASRVAQEGNLNVFKDSVNAAFNIELDDAAAQSALSELGSMGILSYSQFFQWANSLNEGMLGDTLQNKVAVANSFLETLVNTDKDDLFAGSAVIAAVNRSIHQVDASADSVNLANKSLASVADKLTEEGLVAKAANKGALANANVKFLNEAGELMHETTTGTDGQYIIPANLSFASMQVSGGIDLATRQTFTGQLDAPVGATVINPITNIISATMINNDEGDVDAMSIVANSLNLGDLKLDLLNFDFANWMGFDAAGDTGATTEGSNSVVVDGAANNPQDNAGSELDFDEWGDLSGMFPDNWEDIFNDLVVTGVPTQTTPHVLI